MGGSGEGGVLPLDRDLPLMLCQVVSACGGALLCQNNSLREVFTLKVH